MKGEHFSWQSCSHNGRKWLNMQSKSTALMLPIFLVAGAGEDVNNITTGKIFSFKSGCCKRSRIGVWENTRVKWGNVIQAMLWRKGFIEYCPGKMRIVQIREGRKVCTNIGFPFFFPFYHFSFLFGWIKRNSLDFGLICVCWVYCLQQSKSLLLSRKK